MIFYHLHKICDDVTEQKWQTDNIIEFNDTHTNYFFDFSNKFSPIFKYMNQDVSIINIIDYILNENKTEDYTNILKAARFSINEYQILLREMAYETIRKNYFPNLPSRQSCIFLCRESQLDFWKRTINDNIRIFKINTLDDNIFKSNNKHICLPSDSLEIMNNKAQCYWSYNNQNDDEQDEYLYIGKIKIIEEL